MNEDHTQEPTLYAKHDGLNLAPLPLTYRYMFLFVNAFRTDNEKVVIGIPGERGETDINPLAGTPGQVRKKLMQYVGEKFDEWMAMPDPMGPTEGETSHEDHPDRDSFKVCETVAEDESDDPNFGKCAAGNVAEAKRQVSGDFDEARLGVHTTETGAKRIRIEPSPAVAEETDQPPDEDNNLIGD